MDQDAPVVNDPLPQSVIDTLDPLLKGFAEVMVALMEEQEEMKRAVATMERRFQELSRSVQGLRDSITHHVEKHQKQEQRI